MSLKRVIFALCILGFVYYPANVGIPFPRPPNLALDRTSHADVTSDHFPVPEPTSSLASLPWMQRLPRIKVPVWCRLTFPQAGMWQIAGYAGGVEPVGPGRFECSSESAVIVWRCIVLLYRDFHTFPLPSRTKS